MKNFKITNTNQTDVCVDLVGEDKAEDKVILHPRASVTRSISTSVQQSLRATAGITLTPVA